MFWKIWASSCWFFSAPGLACQAAFKKAEVKLDLLTDIDVINSRGKIRRGIFQVIHWYEKANNRYIKDYVENEESTYLSYWNVNNLYGWLMSQKLPLGGSK